MLNTHQSDQKCPKVIRAPLISAPCRSFGLRGRLRSAAYWWHWWPVSSLIAAARGAAQSHGCSLEHLELELDHWTVKNYGYPMDIPWINGI